MTTPNDEAERDAPSAGSVANDSDILARLRNWRSVHLARLHLVMVEAADEIARLRMTDVERGAIQWAIERTAQMYDDRDGGPIKREAIRDFLRRTR